LANAHLYRDEGSSGASRNRPGLDRWRDHAAFAAFARVLITSPDRLARREVHQVVLLDEWARGSGEGECVERPMSQDPHDPLLLQMRGAVAESERTRMAARLRRGRQAKLRSGPLLPWTVPAYGYGLDPPRPRDPRGVRVDPVQAAIVAPMFAWDTDPQTPATLAWVATQLTETHIPTPRGGPRGSRSSIRAMRRDAADIGPTDRGRTWTIRAPRRPSPRPPVGPGDSQQPAPTDRWMAMAVPAMISRDTFEAAHRRWDHHQRSARRHPTHHQDWLRALVSCGPCHVACPGRTDHHGYGDSVCRGRSARLRAAPAERYTAPYRPAAALDQWLWEDLYQLVTTPTLIAHELQRAQAGAWLPQA
jgi:site-specific DNA recombinase